MMNNVLWAVQSLVALVFLAAGGMKIAKDRGALLADPRMAWANEFSASQIKLIGLAEVLGAIGLIVPQALGVLPVLTPIAAAGLAALMAGAAVTHLRRSEAAAPPLVLGVVSAAVAVGRLVLA
jgi:uncharacterized membrane protein YphA (DoxX/SURF4 family)